VEKNPNCANHSPVILSRSAGYSADLFLFGTRKGTIRGWLRVYVIDEEAAEEIARGGN
jgi:hypothetical protein